jgi:hypothetical protein
MARSNTPKSYACGSCGTLGHNKRTCPALGLTPKATPVKKPRAKKVEAVTVEVEPTIPLATEEQMDDLRALVAQIEAAEAEEQTDEVTETVAEVDATDVDEAFDAEEETEEEDREPTDAELAEIEAEDEAAALALLAEIEALAG